MSDSYFDAWSAERDRADALEAEVERLRVEMSTMHRSVVHECCVDVERLRIEMAQDRELIVTMALHRDEMQDAIDKAEDHRARLLAAIPLSWPANKWLPRLANVAAEVRAEMEDEG